MSFKVQFLVVLTAFSFSSLPPSAMAELSPSFNDKFDTVPADFKDIPATVANQHITIKPPAGTTCAAIYSSKHYGDCDLNAILGIASSPSAKKANIGVIFWAKDNTDYYAVRIKKGDYVDAVHVTPKGIVQVVTDRKGDVDSTIGAPNGVTVSIARNEFHLSVNDGDSGSYKVSSPPAGDSIGLYAESPPDGVAACEFAMFSCFIPKPNNAAK
jgi:hypothetical protein